MGLDGVALVMAIEDKFGFTIPDDVNSEIRTVDDLVGFCLDRIHAADTVYCPSLSSFLSLRHLVRDIRNDPDLRLRPRDHVETVLDESDRKRLWQQLPELLKSHPRELRRPAWLRKTLVVVVLSFPIALMAVFPWHVEILTLIWLAAIALGMILNRLTIKMRTRTPDGYTTFGDITKRIVGVTVATNPPAKTDYDSVFSIIKEIIVDQLGVDDDEVVPTARFVQDLGLG
jgi:acyl carrier protein